MILNISPALLVVGLASLMLATSAPIDLLKTQAHTPQVDTVKVWNCVHISIPGSLYTGSSDPRIVSHGEKLSISIDPSECDQSVIQSAAPWTVFFGNAKDKGANAVVLTHMWVSGKTEYIWEAHPLSQEQQLSASSAPPEYYIQAQAMSQNGKNLLMGRSEPFTIADTDTQQQDPVFLNMSPSHSSIPQDLTKPDIPHPFKRDDKTQEPDAQAVLQTPTALPDAETADAKDVLTQEAHKESPQALETSQASEAASQTTAEAAKADIAAVVLTPKNNLVDETPDQQVVPVTHYPNTPKDTIVPDPSTLPHPSGPNLKSPLDPVKYIPPPAGEATSPKPTSSQTFLKYAGAGAAILSTVGLGLGGVVGGAVGATVGFVFGLVGAAVNAMYSN